LSRKNKQAHKPTNPHYCSSSYYGNNRVSLHCSYASAKCPASLNKATGTIDSIQNGKNGKPEWILSGAWNFKNMNTISPTFNSTFNMAMLNGSEPHMHTIKDFKMSVSAGHTSTSLGNLTNVALDTMAQRL
jgi:hypothetical protein